MMAPFMQALIDWAAAAPLPNPSSTSVTVLAELEDPTPDGIITRVGNTLLKALALLAPFAAGGFYAWDYVKGGAKWTKESMATARQTVIGLFIVEGILASIFWFANYGQDFFSQFLGGV